MLSCEFCKFFKNTFFCKTPPVAASDNWVIDSGSDISKKNYCDKRILIVYFLAGLFKVITNYHKDESLKLITINLITVRFGSRVAATSKMECFVIIVNGLQPLTIITKHSILVVAIALDPPLIVDNIRASNLFRSY